VRIGDMVTPSNPKRLRHRVIGRERERRGEKRPHALNPARGLLGPADVEHVADPGDEDLARGQSAAEMKRRGRVLGPLAEGRIADACERRAREARALPVQERRPRGD